MDYLEVQMLDKQPMEGEALSGHPLSAYRQILQKELTCQQSLPWEFQSPGKMDVYGETGRPCTPDKLCHKLSHLSPVMPIHLS